MNERISVVKTPIGVFAISASHGAIGVNRSTELVYYELFDKNPARAVEQFLADIPASFLDKLKEYEISENPAILRKHIRSYAIDLGFVKDDVEFNAFLSEFSAILSRKRMKTSASRDKLVIQASNALEDLSRMQNLLLERLREWYGLHHPELRVSHKEFVSAVLRYGRRENFPDFRESVGVELTSNDETILKQHAAMINEVMEQRKNIEVYVREAMHEIAPNLSSLIDELLAARLLASAGSMEKLAKMSASTIQLIGAEKALFRHIRKQGRAPKYGILFLSSQVQNASDDKKGKVARALAAKIMQAVRIDFYSGRFEEELKRELDDEIKKVS